MAEQNWRVQFQLLNQADGIRRERGIGVAASRSARLSMTACIRKDYVKLARKRAGQRRQASAASDQAVQGDQRRLISACSQKVNVDAIRLAPAARPIASDIRPVHRRLAGLNERAPGGLPAPSEPPPSHDSQG